MGEGYGQGPLDLSKNHAQKGPFLPGSKVRATPLLPDGSFDRNQQVVTTTGANGSFVLPPVGWSGPTWVEVEGTFFDETSGGYVGEPIPLTALRWAEDGKVTGNINLLTHLFAARVRQQIRLPGTKFDYALPRTQEDFYWLGFEHDPASLNFFHVTDDLVLANENAALLLFSSAFVDLGFGQKELDALTAKFTRSNLLPNPLPDRDIYAEVTSHAFEHRIRLLDQAARHLEERYPVSTPTLDLHYEFPWLRSGCSYLADEARICPGNFTQVSLDPGEEHTFFYDVPRDGTYSVRASAYSRHSRAANYWTLYRDYDPSTQTYDGVIWHCTGASDDCGVAPMGSNVGYLEADRRYYLRYHNTVEVLGVSLEISIASDGSETSPQLLPYGRAHGGRAGYRTDTAVAYYKVPVPDFPAPRTGKVVLREFSCGGAPDALSPLVSLYGPGLPFQNLVGQVDGQDCEIELEHVFEPGSEMYVKVENRLGIYNRPAETGSFTFTITVGAD